MYYIYYVALIFNINFCLSFLIGTVTGHLGDDTNKILISFPCEIDNDCKEHFNKNTVCKKGKCVCENNNDFSCLETLNTIIGEKCTHNFNCDIIDSHCINHICSCKHGYISSANKRKCLPVAQRLNESCEIDAQCEQNLPASVCFKNICMCKLHYYEYNETCYKKSGLGKACSQHENCLHIENTICDNHICKCQSEYSEDRELEFCLPIFKNTTCTQNEQCIAKFGKEAQCVNSKCVCKMPFHINDDGMKCVYSKGSKKSFKRALIFMGVVYGLLFVIFFY